MAWAQEFPLGTKGRLLLNDTGDTIIRAYMMYDNPGGPSQIQVATAFTLGGQRQPLTSYRLNNQAGWQEVLWRYTHTTEIVSFHMSDTGTPEMGGEFNHSYPIYRGGDLPAVARIRQGGTFRTAVPYVKVAGVWKTVQPYVKHAGDWKRTQ